MDTSHRPTHSGLPFRYPLAALSLAASVLALSACGTGTAVPLPTTPTSSATSTPRSAASTPNDPTSTAAESAVPAESAPPGDIPDNLAFVRYDNKPGGYSFTHPEGWVETEQGARVQFTDKLNGVVVDSTTAAQAPTVATARSTEVSRLKASVAAFELRNIGTATVPAGHAVRITFRQNSVADPVTGKVYRDEVQEYLVFSAGRLVRMNLFGPVGADNVDAYAAMSQSLTIR